MPYLKPKRIHGRTYWYVVESRRVGSKVKTVNLAYLGRPEDILARWNKLGMPAERLKSYSHGGIAVLLSLADRLEIAQLIDRHAGAPRGSLGRHKTLSVGRTLLAAALGRALHPTSKRGWAKWARTTTLGKLWGLEPAKITSQYFWDQMDRLPLKSFGPLQAELGRRVLDRFGVSAESLFYDTTNFYTFIDSRNRHCDLPQRGHAGYPSRRSLTLRGKNKQKRNDLRQFQLGLLVSRDGWVPLLAKLFRGNLNDVTTFPVALQAIRRQCKELGIAPAQVTLVADKGNISRKNWRLLDESEIGHVVSVVPSHYKEWSTRPLDDFSACEVPDMGEVNCLRAKAVIAGRERTLVVLDSPTLRAGQLRGLDQQLRKPIFALSRLVHTLQGATRRRRRDLVERQIENALKPAVMRKLFRYELTERKHKPGLQSGPGGAARRSVPSKDRTERGRKRPGYWDIDWWIDMEVYRHRRERIYGRRILVTGRHEWPTPEIVRAYWGQAEAEHVFERLKDPEFLALRPQHHWTDQKIEVHALLCVVGYLLAALLRREARRMGYTEGLPRLLEMLNEIRLVLRTEVRGRAGRPRISRQLEEADPETLRLYRSLVDQRYELGPTRAGD